MGWWTPPNDPAYWWRLIVQMLEMVGVVGAVVLALWDKLRPVFRKPKLKLDFENPSETIAEEVTAVQRAGQSSVQYICTVLLENIGKMPAAGCTLYVVKCRRLDQGGTPVGLGKRLRAHPTPWDANKESVVVHPGLPHSLRLFIAAEQQAASTEAEPDERKAVLSLPLVQEDGEGDALVLEPGTHELHLAVVAEGGYRAELLVHIRHTGEWHDRLVKMKPHLSAARRDR